MIWGGSLDVRKLRELKTSYMQVTTLPYMLHQRSCIAETLMRGVPSRS
jgi:hypothetical protein